MPKRLDQYNEGFYKQFDRKVWLDAFAESYLKKVEAMSDADFSKLYDLIGDFVRQPENIKKAPEQLLLDVKKYADTLAVNVSRNLDDQRLNEIIREAQGESKIEPVAEEAVAEPVANPVAKPVAEEAVADPVAEPEPVEPGTESPPVEEVSIETPVNGSVQAKSDFDAAYTAIIGEKISPEMKETVDRIYKAMNTLMSSTEKSAVNKLRQVVAQASALAEQLEMFISSAEILMENEGINDPTLLSYLGFLKENIPASIEEVSLEEPAPAVPEDIQVEVKKYRKLVADATKDLTTSWQEMKVLNYEKLETVSHNVNFVINQCNLFIGQMDEISKSMMGREAQSSNWMSKGIEKIKDFTGYDQEKKGTEAYDKISEHLTKASASLSVIGHEIRELPEKAGGDSVLKGQLQGAVAQYGKMSEAFAKTVAVFNGETGLSVSAGQAADAAAFLVGSSVAPEVPQAFENAKQAYNKGTGTHQQNIDGAVQTAVHDAGLDKIIAKAVADALGGTESSAKDGLPENNANVEKAASFYEARMRFLSKGNPELRASLTETLNAFKASYMDLKNKIDDADDANNAKNAESDPAEAEASSEKQVDAPAQDLDAAIGQADKSSKEGGSGLPSRLRSDDTQMKTVMGGTVAQLKSFFKEN